MVILRSPTIFLPHANFPVGGSTAIAVLCLCLAAGSCEVGGVGEDAGEPEAIVDAGPSPQAICGLDVNQILVQGTTVSVTGPCLIRDSVGLQFFNGFESAFFFGDLVVFTEGDVVLESIRSIRGGLRFGDQIGSARLNALETVGGVIEFGAALEVLELRTLGSAFGVDFVGHSKQMTIDLPAAIEIDVVSGFNSSVVGILLPRLQTTKVVEIVACPNLEILDLHSLQSVDDRLEIRENPKLSDCRLPVDVNGVVSTALGDNGETGDACRR